MIGDVVLDAGSTGAVLIPAFGSAASVFSAGNGSLTGPVVEVGVKGGGESFGKTPRATVSSS